MEYFESDCWSKAHKRYIDGDLDGAIEICISKECSESSDCQRLAAWAFYSKNLYDMAMHYFKIAAAKGDIESHFGIGCACYALGDYMMAIDSFSRAAELGYGRAYHWVGGMYMNGIGVPMKYWKAVYFLCLGADAGYLISQRWLISVENKRGGIFRKIFNFPRYLSVILRGAIIAVKNPKDERIIDVPNAFDRFN
ncbi:tetratricopeptide repeat protein [Ottowia sp.]|uniref:tetratricopeptide repeat protein n=1 Tax=Ottowia sp. TaxID=1898956 RepID=UPI003A86884B